LTNAKFPVGKKFAVRKELRVDTGNVSVGRLITATAVSTPAEVMNFRTLCLLCVV